MDLRHLSELQKRYPDGPGYRVLSQLHYALRLCEMDRLDPGPAYRVLRDLAALQREGGVDRAQWQAAEQALSGAYATAARRYTVLCAGHAHIDMNWMWGWDETVPVTLDTFETVLKLMEEFPGFTFSQSQASVYEIVERFAPAMLDEIRRRVHEGRWEVTASTWVEADRNMVPAESVARHLLYTRRYLSKLLGIPIESMALDFEPDTFGHGAHTPTALARGGVRWYYHCRGDEGPTLYRWRAPSGDEVLSYREPDWYLGPIAPDLVVRALDFCAETGLTTALWVYGVGDHGGGPTRRDLTRITEYADWPVFPAVRFGRIDEFFRQAETIRDTLPVVEGELNFVFTGCYTSQSRIKEGNYRCQKLLTQAEAWDALAAVQGLRTAGSLADAWKAVLFNQFHDIVTGSCVAATRERAMGEYQQVKARAGALRSQALRAIAAAVDTSAWADDADTATSTSEGAGVGFGAAQGRATQTGRHAGSTRLFHVFNPSPYERDEVVELTLWDMDADPAELSIRDAEGRELPCQPVKKDFSAYWGHHYVTVLTRIRVPAMGRSLCAVSPRPRESVVLPGFRAPRVERTAAWTLENERLRAVFAPDGRLSSLTDKERGAELLSAPAGFCFAKEDPGRRMTAWIVGRSMRDISAHTGPVRLVALETGPLRSTLSYQIPFGEHSELTVTATLDSGSPLLRLDATCRFLEWGTSQTWVPQLYFTASPANPGGRCRYDAPLGPIARPALPIDVPALSHAVVPCGSAGLLLSSPGRHGYRWHDGSLRVTLIRGSFDPDPYPELGDHAFTVALGAADLAPGASYRMIDRLSAPLTAISDGAHPGVRAAVESGLAVGGPVRLLCFKAAEDGRGYILRLLNLSDGDATADVALPAPPRSVVPVDLLERPTSAFPGTLSGHALSLPMTAHDLVSLRIEF
ncbi:MAG: alpha-mannosidase [Christensenellales bacterium]|jgi:alpha-mannosidase